MKIGWLLFENYNQRKNIGSSRIRGKWLIEQIPEAEEFVQGEKYDAIIFQKSYWKEMARSFEGLKVLDICDPDWLEGAEIVNFIQSIDLVICPTEKLAEEIRNFSGEIPVVVIPDGVKMEGLPAPKIHTERAKKVCWFGYSQNWGVLDQTLLKLKKLGLKLKVISDGNYSCGEISVENVKWDIETVNQEIKDCDICIFPDYLRGTNSYKSNNKTLQSWALGIPVAKTPQDLERFMEANERNKEAELRYKEAKENYSIEKVAEMYYNIIKEHLNKKSKK